MNKAALYVLENEQTKRLMIVHVYNDHENAQPNTLAEHLKFLDETYTQLRIDFVNVKGTFGPELIERLSKRKKVPKIGCPGDNFPHNIAELGGVRLIV